MRNLRDLLAENMQNNTLPHLWLLPFCTLMVVFMILFAVLYSFAQTNAMDYEAIVANLATGEQRTQSMKEVKLAREMRDFIAKMKLEGIAEVSITAHSIKLKLNSPAIFDVGSAEIKPEIMPLMAELLIHLKDISNTIIVEGHTDNIPVGGGKYPSNWELSAARAFSVIYFYMQRGIDPRRLVAHGYGEHRPAFPNDSDLGRALNRRIEITIVRGVSTGTTTGAEKTT